MTTFFYYKHPKTGKIYSDQRMSGFEEVPYMASDGVKCELLKDYCPDTEDSKNQIGIINKNAEVFQKDSAFVKKCKPKYVKFRDGHREKYDPTRHC
ncbi:MAG: hypothetical protein KAH05_00310 [Clostridiales bacterium]|nr:hypothetical protein [Clostridiales bacterium]